MNTDSALALARAFAEAEHQAFEAAAKTKDLFGYMGAVVKVHRLFVAKHIWSEPARPASPGDGWYEKATSELTNKAPRTIHAISRFDMPGGRVWAAYLSNIHTDFDYGIFHRLLIAEVDSDPKIVAMQARCTTCRTTGRYRGVPCGDCDGVGWLDRGASRKLGDPGEAVETRKLQAPTDPDSLALYEALGQ